jgi:hypothetical protein
MTDRAMVQRGLRERTPMLLWIEMLPSPGS